jgi:hypothetical protein
MESVSERLHRLVDSRHRFVSVLAGWQRFLQYLDARNGADIDAAHRSEMAMHLDYVEDDVDDPDVKPDESKAAELEAFGSHADVISAFQKFCVAEMLPTA